MRLLTFLTRYQRVDTTSKSGASNEPSTSQNFTLVMSQTEKFRDVSYTLNVLGTVPFRFYPAPQPPPNKVEFTGSWSSETSGGSMLSPKFYCNPQYRIVIGGNQAIHIHIQAFYPKEIYASISVCKSGNRLDSMTPEDEVLRCQKYRCVNIV
jgi:calpain-7